MQKRVAESGRRKGKAYRAQKRRRLKRSQRLLLKSGRRKGRIG